MKVLLVGRYEGGLIRGGAEYQLELTRDLLRAAGHDVAVVSPEVQEWGDLVHFFGTSEYFWSMASLCQEKGVPYVVSSIWYEGGSRRDVWMARKKRELEIRYPRKSRKLLQGAARILVPSEDVKWRLSTFFDTDPCICEVVPSGAVRANFGEAMEDEARKAFGLEGDYVLCVGNFLERKNQRGLIKAMQGSGKLVVFAGGASDEPYFEGCKQLAGSDKNFRFLGSVGRELLGGLVRGARVFAVPSILEDFMIAGVEAGALGKPLVLSRGWNAEEVYGEWGRYPSPVDSAAIRAAVDSAWEVGGDVLGQADWFLERYSEEAFLRRTLEVYRQALE